MTEVNKRGAANSGFQYEDPKANGRQNLINNKNKQNEEHIEVLSDKNQRQKIKNAFDMQDEELKEKLIKMSQYAPRLEL